MGQLSLEMSGRHMYDNKVFKSNLQGITKGTLFLTNPITYDEMSDLGRAMASAYLDSQSTDTG